MKTKRDEMERLLLRPIEAAEAIGVGRSKIYELLARGELPSIRVGSSVRVPVDALRTWIARQLDDASSGNNR
jgi:excisionase family DNA binding protein